MIDREIKARFGKKRRLECAVPKTLTEPQVERRKTLVKELAALLRSIGETTEVPYRLLLKLAHAPDADEAGKVEKSIRRYASEPKKVSVAVAKSKTFGEFALHWATGGLFAEHPRKVRSRGDRTMKVDKSRVDVLNHIIGHIELVNFTEADANRALDNLPEDVESASTIRHYAQIIQTVMRRAVSPGGIIDAKSYPLGDKFLPPIGTPPSYPFLYPNDVTMLLRCLKLEAWKRMLYGFAIYEGMRVSHIFRLRWRNIDFESGFITIGIGKNNKNARTWELNAGTQWALEWFQEDAAGEDYIFPRLTKNEILKLSEGLREDLVTAGVTREFHGDLFAYGDGQRPIRFQDLRATFVSLHLAMGWTEVDVMIRTQHTSTKVLHHHYARRLGLAQSVIKKQGELPSLDVAMGIRRASRSPKGGGKGGGNNRVAA